MRSRCFLMLIVSPPHIEKVLLCVLSVLAQHVALFFEQGCALLQFCQIAVAIFHVALKLCNLGFEFCDAVLQQFGKLAMQTVFHVFYSTKSHAIAAVNIATTNTASAARWYHGGSFGTGMRRFMAHLR